MNTFLTLGAVGLVAQVLMNLFVMLAVKSPSARFFTETWCLPGSLRTSYGSSSSALASADVIGHEVATALSACTSTLDSARKR